MEFGPIERPVYQSEVICKDYFLRGGFQPIGPMLPFLNDVGRRFIEFQDATLTAYDAGNPLTKLHPSAVMLGKQEILAVSILDPAGVEAAQLFATSYKMIVYTSRFVIQGNLHMGAEDTPLDFLSDSNADFVGMTDTSLYPLVSSQRQPQLRAALMIINRSNVLFYHERAEG
jgi:hypothetical protein